MSTTPAYCSYISKIFLSTSGARFFFLATQPLNIQRLPSLWPGTCMEDLIPELNHSVKGTDTKLSLAFQDSSPSTTWLALQRSSLHQVPLQHELVFSLMHIPPPNMGHVWVDRSASTWKVPHGSPSPGCLVLKILVKGYAFYIWHVILFTPTKDWFYYVYKCFSYMYVCQIHASCPLNVRRGQWMPSNWCYRWLWAAMEVLGINRSLLPKKQVFLTAEQSLWPRELLLYCVPVTSSCCVVTKQA